MFRFPFLSMLLVFTCLGAAQAADLRLASIFSDGVVIQRNQKIPVWGQGEPGATVEVSLNQQHGQATIGADGWWRVDLEPMPAGGPYTLKALMASQQVMVADVLCGDVWLCSGQSNMQMGTAECVGGERAVAEAVNYPHLRLLQLAKAGANEPQRTLQTVDGLKWHRATPETAGKFAAVGYFFALQLLQDPALKDVPIGLIDSSFGGTAAEAWTPSAELTWLSKEQRSPSMFNLQPSTLYNSMIAPLAPGGLTGVLWYQGESNSGQPEIYSKILTSLIQGWRRRWDRPGLPFFIVELPPFADKIGGHYFTWLRDAQAKVAREVPRCDLVTTVNTTDGADLHPRHKAEIGYRAALLARRDVYGESVVAQGPVFKGVQPRGKRLHVAFDTAGQGLASREFDRVGGFQIAGEDGVYYYADAAIYGDEVDLQSEHVPAPKTVRYAWSAIPQADLVNRDGLPAAPFRTDTLPPTDTEFVPTPVLHRLVTKSIDLTVDGKGSIRSLGVGGQQMLSNSFGASGGTSFPGGFGSLELSREEQVGPDRFRFHNDSVALEITGDDESTTWAVTNAGKDEAKFRITLANGVNATEQDGVVRLERFLTRARIEGAGELQKPGPDGQVLLTNIPAHAKVVLKISQEK